MIFIKKSELLKLSVAQTGNSFGYMVFYFLLPEFYKYKVFQKSLIPLGLENLLNTITFSIITIPFTISAIIYIFAGYLSDRTITRFGRRRPYFLLVIPGAICYMLLGLYPDIYVSMGFPLNFILILIFATLYAVLYRIIYCAYWSLYMDLTAPEERVRTSIVFNLFGLIGTIAAFFVPVFVGDVESYFEVIIIIGIVYMSLMLFVFFLGPKEDIEKLKEIKLSNIKSPGFIYTMKESLKDRNFRYYMILSFFYTLGYSMMTTIFMDFLTFKQTYISIEFWQIFIALLLTAILGFYLYEKLAKKWTKIKAFKFGLIIGFSIQPFMIFLGVQGSPIFLTISIIMMFCTIIFVIVAILTFQYAILMDITPENKEATYSGIYLFITGIGMPVASALIGLINDSFRGVPSIFNFWHYREVNIDGEIVWGHDFAYALFILIASICYAIAFLLLRKIKYKEE